MDRLNYTDIDGTVDDFYQYSIDYPDEKKQRRERSRIIDIDHKLFDLEMKRIINQDNPHE